MDRNEIRDAMTRLSEVLPGYDVMLEYIEESPFNEEIWKSLEDKGFRDTVDLIVFMEA
ncbi:MAG: hypothetical protein IKH39_09135 [Candidatus Methanomethylophilaceae archaeon]|nr:hypothetical protein [Candidatus Methanomethylophilaceae archaeon]